MNKEITYLSGFIENPLRPLVAIIGGVKVSTKMEVLKTLVQRVDKLFIGGAMASTFLKAAGFSVSDSFVEENFLSAATEILDYCRQANKMFKLPIDVVVMPSDNNTSIPDSERMKSRMFDTRSIPAGFQIMDIGPNTVDDYVKELDYCSTILINGKHILYSISFDSRSFFKCNAV